MLISAPAYCPVCGDRVDYSIDDELALRLPPAERQAFVDHTIAGHAPECEAYLERQRSRGRVA